MFIIEEEVELDDIGLFQSKLFHNSKLWKNG